MKKTIILIAVLLTALFFAKISLAATYYVSTTGSDSNPGTQAQPWKTIQKAANTLQPGDTVYIRAGTYNEKVTPTRSGTSGNYITYRSYSGEAVTINAAGRDSGFQVSGRSYIQVIDLKVVGDRAGGSGTYAGVWVADNSNNIILDGIEATKNRFGIYLQGESTPLSYVTIKNSLLHDNPFHGLWVAEKAYDITVGPNNKMYNNQGEEIYSFGIECGTDYGGPFSDGPRRVNIFGNEVYGNYMQGIRTWNAAYVWIHNNIIYDNGATGIQLEDGTENVVVEDNTCYHNADIYAYETGIWVAQTNNVAVRNNTLRYNKVGFMVTDSTRVIAHNNIISENNRGVPHLLNAMGINLDASASQVTLAHNTLYKNGAPETQRGGMTTCAYHAPVDAVVLKNNIISETTANSDMWLGCNNNFISDYNDVYNTRTVNVNWLGSDKTWAEYKSTSGKDANSISSNPKFVDPSNGNFNLQATSPCKDTGDFLTRTSGSGSGTTVTVSDASYFTDGFGTGAAGDLVQIGSNSPVRITNVDYGTNTIAVDRSISWNSGDGVSYTYSGSAPDIGAYEYLGTTQTCSDGTAYNQCSSTKPKYCSSGTLINNCQSCSCPSGQQCQVDGSCKTSADGDVNLDGQVNVLDVQACVNDILAVQDYGSSADVNKDGAVNILDVQAVVNIILGV